MPEDTNPQLPALPDAVPYQAEPLRRAEMSPRTLGGLITGAVTGITGFLGTQLYITSKMFDFKAKVQEETYKDIMSKRGIAAASTEAPMSGGLGGLGPGMGSHSIEERHALKLAQAEGGVPKFLYKWFGGPHGAGTVALGVGAVAALAGYVGYRAMTKDQKTPDSPYVTPEGHVVIDQPPEAQKRDWATKVAESTMERTPGL